MKTKHQKLAECHTAYQAAKTGQRPKRQAKDGSVPTHPVVPVWKHTTETEVLVECLKLLKSHRIFCNRHDCGSGHGHAIYGIKHSGDIHGILPSGIHFEIEVKRGKGGRLSAGQQERMADVRATNGEYWVVHGLEELVYYIGDLV